MVQVYVDNGTSLCW